MGRATRNRLPVGCCYISGAAQNTLVVSSVLSRKKKCSECIRPPSVLQIFQSILREEVQSNRYCTFLYFISHITVVFRRLVQTAIIRNVKEKQRNPCTGLLQAQNVPGVEVPRFRDNQHIKVVRLSALSTGGLYSPINIHGTHFC